MQIFHPPQSNIRVCVCTDTPFAVLSSMPLGSNRSLCTPDFAIVEGCNAAGFRTLKNHQHTEDATNHDTARYGC